MNFDLFGITVHWYEIILGLTITAAYLVPYLAHLPVRYVLCIGFGWQLFLLATVSAVTR